MPIFHYELNFNSSTFLLHLII